MAEDGSFVDNRIRNQRAPSHVSKSSARGSSAAKLVPIRQRSAFMGLFTKDIKTMDDLLLHGLKDIYYAENQIVKSLPKLIEKATNRDLSKGLRDHLEETKNQVARIEQVFKKHGENPKGVKCPAIDV